MTDRRIKRSNRALLDASFQVLLHNPHASLSEIANQAGVGRATLYRHFPTRENLLAAIAIESLEIVEQATAKRLRCELRETSAIEQLVSALLPLADRFHFLQMMWTDIELDAEVCALYEQQMAALERWITAGQRNGVLSEQLQPQWIVVMLDSMLYSASWLISTHALSPKEAEQQLLIGLLNGISGHKLTN